MQRLSNAEPGTLRNAVAAVALVVCMLLAGTPARSQDAVRKYYAPAIVPLDGRIDLPTAKGFERRLERANDAKSDLLVIEIDVAGGTPEGARVVCEAIRRTGGARKIAFVPRRAMGPGVAAALCCDEVHLRPDAVIGDVSELAAGGGRVEWLKLLETWTREQRRPVELVAKMTGEGDAAARVYSGKEAVAERLADGNVETIDEILARHNVNVSAHRFSDSWVDQTVAVLNHPVATTALVVTGLIFLYVEIAAAGIGLAALPAALCFLLFFWSKFLGGTAGWLEVVLFVAGLICLGVEIFLIPGFGVVGASGIVLVLLSLVMATQGFLLPRTPTDTRTFIQTLVQWSAGGLLFVAGAAAITKRLGGLPVVKQLVLAPSEGVGAVAGDGFILPNVMSGVAVTDLRPVGKARFGERLYDVVTDGFYIAAGSPVRIVEATATRIQVSRV
jgi:membrane-bound serine protease (ClpP class)